MLQFLNYTFVAGTPEFNTFVTGVRLFFVASLIVTTILGSYVYRRNNA